MICWLWIGAQGVRFHLDKMDLNKFHLATINREHTTQCPSSIAVMSPKFKHWVLHFLTARKNGPGSRLIVVAGLILFFVSGCGAASAVRVAAPTPTTPTPSFVTASPEIALPRLIELERQASIDKNLGLLAQLWAEESQIVDGRGTPTLADNYIWAGRSAILDRYVVAVFPNPPPPLPKLGDFTLHVTADQATVAHGQDRWQFVKRANRWWLAALVYSQP